MKFIVKREHFGDKMYMTGDTREADERDVKHLIDKGVLVKDGSADLEDRPTAAANDVAAQKADAAPRNKAETRAPKNKSAK